MAACGLAPIGRHRHEQLIVVPAGCGLLGGDAGRAGHVVEPHGQPNGAALGDVTRVRGEPVRYVDHRRGARGGEFTPLAEPRPRPQMALREL